MGQVVCGIIITVCVIVVMICYCSLVVASKDDDLNGRD